VVGLVGFIVIRRWRPFSVSHRWAGLPPRGGGRYSCRCSRHVGRCRAVWGRVGRLVPSLSGRALPPVRLFACYALYTVSTDTLQPRGSEGRGLTSVPSLGVDAVQQAQSRTAAACMACAGCLAWMLVKLVLLSGSLGGCGFPLACRTALVSLFYTRLETQCL
jgi:hypothetical protein